MKRIVGFKGDKVFSAQRTRPPGRPEHRRGHQSQLYAGHHSHRNRADRPPQHAGRPAMAHATPPRPAGRPVPRHPGSPDPHYQAGPRRPPSPTQPVASPLRRRTAETGGGAARHAIVALQEGKIHPMGRRIRKYVPLLWPVALVSTGTYGAISAIIFWAADWTTLARDALVIPVCLLPAAAFLTWTAVGYGKTLDKVPKSRCRMLDMPIVSDSGIPNHIPAYGIRQGNFCTYVRPWSHLARAGTDHPQDVPR